MVEINRPQDCETKSQVQVNEGNNANYQGCSRNDTNAQLSRSSNGDSQIPQSTVGSFHVGAYGCPICAEDPFACRCTECETNDERKAWVSELKLCLKSLKTDRHSAHCQHSAGKK